MRAKAEGVRSPAAGRGGSGRWERACAVACGVTAAIAAIVLVGWIIGDRRLVTFGGPGLAMPNTAVVVIVLCVGIVLGARERDRWARWLAASVVLYELEVVLEHATGFDPGISGMLVDGKIASGPGAGLPAMQTAIMAMMLAASIWFLAPRREAGGFRQSLGWVLAVVALGGTLAIVGGLTPGLVIPGTIDISVPTLSMLVMVAGCIQLWITCRRWTIQPGWGGMSVRLQLAHVLTLPTPVLGAVVAMVAVFILRVDDPAAARTVARVSAIGLAMLVWVSWWIAGAVARSMQRRLREISEAAERMGSGDFAEQAVGSDVDEIGVLARSFDDMRLALAERVAAEQQARQQLMAINDARNEFMSVVAHDLRAPLTVTGHMADVLISEGETLTEEERAYYLRRIRIKTRHLSSFVDDLLHVQRIEAGELGCRSVPFDLGTVVRRVVGEFSTIHPTRPFRAVVPEGLPPALGDERRQWQVLSNLLVNACKFSAETQPVDVRIRPGTAHLAVTVQDHGVGIPARDLAVVFEKYARSKEARSAGTSDSGLGLYICKSLVEAQGGTIAVDSVEGSGAAFTYTVPVAP